MSILLQWIPADQLLPTEQVSSVVSVKIYSSLVQEGPFSELATIAAVDQVTGKFIDVYEDQTGLMTTWYKISFININGQESALTVAGTGGFLSRQHEFLEDVRYRLYDFNPNLYRLDEFQAMWSTTQLWRFLSNAVNKINQTGPMLTNYTMDNVVCTELVKDYAVLMSLKARGILENFNQFKFSDGVGLDWNRAQPLFSAAATDYQVWLSEVKAFKLANRPRALGSGSQRLPFQVLRPMSFLPNMKNTFGI